MFEKIQRQIIGKVIYSTFIVSFTYIFHPKLDLYALLSKCIGISCNGIFFSSLVLFIVFTTIFKIYMKRKIESGLFLIEVKDAKEKISRIVKEGHSLVDDVRPRNISGLLFFISIYLISGISIFFILMLSINQIIINLHPNIAFIYFLITLSAIYIIQDSPKMDYLEKIRTQQSRYIFNILEMYVIENTAKKVLGGSIVSFLFKVVYRVLSPVYYPETPDIKFDSIFVYRNPKIFDFLQNLDDIKLNHEDGLCLDLLKTVDKCEKATFLATKSPYEIFPYLFDSKYEYDDKSNKKWSFFRILKKERGFKTMGYMFIHCFKTVKIKVLLKYRSKIKKQYEPEIAFFFIFFGKSDIIEYIKSEIDLISVGVPNEVINMELSP